MELKLHQAGALNRLRFHMLDARDVKEVILVIVSEIALHLRGVHAPERLRDVNRGDAERRENVARQPLQSDPGTERNRDDQHDDGEWSA